MEKGHLHTGPISIVVAGVSALIFFNVIKIAAANMVLAKNPTISGAGKILGSLVTFGG